MSSLEGKVALVTGAGNKRSIGRQVALRLVGEGADVAVNDVTAVPQSRFPGDEDWGGLAEVVKEIKAAGRQGLAVVGDVSSSGDVERMVAETLDKFGKIDILVHCAGIRGPADINVPDLDEASFNRVLDVNVRGTFLVTRAVSGHMLKDPEGKKIVVIGSVAGTFATPGSAAYATSKWAMVGFTKSLALELAPHHINVNIIHPDTVFTNVMDGVFADKAKEAGVSWEEIRKEKHAVMAKRSPWGRPGTAEEVADLVFFLVSDQSRYISGQVITISGGSH
jgi:NAD(P)-dependent dehydrogenase (short-subunit alcohol dehydrogenase family)